MRISGRGCPLAIWFAIDQILRFAPSIRPDIEPVVSRTKTTSMRGATPSGGGGGRSGSTGVEVATWATIAVAATRLAKTASLARR